MALPTYFLKSEHTPTPTPERIAVLNWRDSSHPRAGGAELFAEEIASRLAEHAEVTFLTARPKGTPRTEVRSGVTYRRAGGTLGVYLRVALHLLVARLLRRGYDAVIDCQNGIPFFSTLLTSRSTPVVLVMHHVHQDQFSQHFPAPVALLGRFLEGPVSRLAYRRAVLAPVSPSTLADVRSRLGYPFRHVLVPNGRTPALVPASTPQPGRLVCVGRLVAHKRVDLALHALASLLPTHPDLHLDVIGDGPERSDLEVLARELGISSSVTLHGRVSDEERDTLLSSASLAVTPSSGEGWGLVVIEAAAYGVPTIGFDVAGLRDSIRPETGWLLPSPEDSADLVPTLAEGIASALASLPSPRMAQTCRDWSDEFTWDASTQKMRSALELARRSQPTHS